MASAEILAAAKDYIARGWHVFPVHGIANEECTCGKTSCPDSAKHPVTHDGLKSATTDLAQIESWFGPTTPLYNIGIVAGKKSGLTIVDIDVGSNKMGAETWAALIEESGEPDTLMVKTGGNGLHVYF